MGSDGQRYLDGQDPKFWHKWEKIYQEMNDSFDIEKAVLENGHSVTDIVQECKYDLHLCNKTVNFKTYFDVLVRKLMQ